MELYCYFLLSKLLQNISLYYVVSEAVFTKQSKISKNFSDKAPEN